MQFRRVFCLYLDSTQEIYISSDSLETSLQMYTHSFSLEVKKAEILTHLNWHTNWKFTIYVLVSSMLTVYTRELEQEYFANVSNMKGRKIHCHDPKGVVSACDLTLCKAIHCMER